MLERLYTNNRLQSEFEQAKEDVLTLEYEIKSKWIPENKRRVAQDDLKVLRTKYDSLKKEMVRRGFEV